MPDHPQRSTQDLKPQQRTPEEEALIERTGGCWWCIEVEKGRARRCPSHD